jgi:GNAT superfamily N-acetyltransferase
VSDVTLRRAEEEDASLLATHRAAVWHEVGEWSMADLTPQIDIWTAFFRRCIVDETYVAFIAERAAQPVGSGALLIHLGIPRPGLSSERVGRVQSMYVAPDARRRGVARALIDRLIAYGREAKLISLALHPSDAARPLYTAVGFAAADEMTLQFTG